MISLPNLASLETASPHSRVLLVLGVLVFTLALRTCRHPFLQKLGAICIFLTSFLIGWLFTHSRVVGACLAASWLFMPWFDLLTRTRKLSIPLERSFRHKAPPNAHHFPALLELTDEVEGEGFEHIDDVGWESDESQQFFRFFYKPDEHTQAAICLVDQNDIAFYYVRISSRARNGEQWLTWNYPFSYSLKLVPQWRVQRFRGDLSFLQLMEAHRDRLRQHGITSADLEERDPVTIQTDMQDDQRMQITHNVAMGVLKKDREGGVRYSWRGLFYLWFQFLRDIVRFS